LAASQPDRAFGGGELQKIVRIEGEDRTNRRTRDEATGDIEEGEITGEANGEIVRDVFAELIRRRELLGQEYPFEIEMAEAAVGNRARLKWRPNAGDHPGALAYLYCLLISSRRHTMLGLTEADEDRTLADGLKLYSEYRYGLLMQVCATIALGGYLRGDVISFGYPRPDGSAFLDAHQQAWKRFGAYVPVSQVPLGAPDHENDAGIDLLGWLSFPDGHASKVLVIGQVASGRNWSGKSAWDRANALRSWFKSPSFNHFIPMMVMPFNITDARKTIQRGEDDLRRAVFEIEERQFGIVLDRDRVAASVGQALALDDLARARIEGVEKFDQVAVWVGIALADLTEAA
jgi:hypothetical protein